MSNFLQALSAFFSGDNLLAVLLLALLLSVLTNLGTAYRLMRKSGRKLRPNKVLEAVRRFFTEQLHELSNASRHKQRKHISRKVIRLRTAYLSIERSCLDKGVGTPAYWAMLDEKLQDLLKIYAQHQSGRLLESIKSKIVHLKTLLKDAPVGKSKEKVMLALQQLEYACKDAAASHERLVKIDDKLNKLLEKFINESYRKNNQIAMAGEKYVVESEKPLQAIGKHEEAFEKFASNSEARERDDCKESIEAMADNSEAMRERISFLEGELQRTRQMYQLKMSDMESLSDEEKMSRIGDDLRDISDEIIAAGEREIERLNHLVQEKQIIITDLESSLRKSDDGGVVVGENDEKKDGRALSGAYEKELDLLRKNLHEAEQCVVLLERELELLKDARRQLDAEQPQSASSEEVESLNKTIETLKHEVFDYEVAWKEKDLLIGFVQECLEAGTAEDISLSVYQCLQDMGFNAELIVKAPTRVLEINEVGALSARNKLVINNMHLGEVNSIDKNRRMAFRFGNIGGLIQRPDHAEITKKETQNIVELVKLSDKILDKVLRSSVLKQRKNTLDAISNSLRIVAKDTDDTFDKHFLHVEKSIETAFGQLEDVARSSGMSAAGVAGIKNTKKQLSAELMADKVQKLKLHKSLLKVLQKIEDVDD